MRDGCPRDERARPVAAAPPRQPRGYVGPGGECPSVPGTFRTYLAQEVPFGTAKTGAYLMFALADALDLLQAGAVAKAEAILCLTLAAGEQAALSGWNWTLP